MEGRLLLVSHILGDVPHGPGSQAEPSIISPLTPIRGVLDCSNRVGEKAVSAKTRRMSPSPNNEEAVSMQMYTFLRWYMQFPLSWTHQALIHLASSYLVF